MLAITHDLRLRLEPHRVPALTRVHLVTTVTVQGLCMLGNGWHHLALPEAVETLL